MRAALLSALLAAGCSMPPEPCDGADVRYYEIMSECEQHLAQQCVGLLPRDCPYARECDERVRNRCVL